MSINKILLVILFIILIIPYSYVSGQPESTKVHVHSNREASITLFPTVRKKPIKVLIDSSEDAFVTLDPLLPSSGRIGKLSKCELIVEEGKPLSFSLNVTDKSINSLIIHVPFLQKVETYSRFIMWNSTYRFFLIRNLSIYSRTGAAVRLGFGSVNLLREDQHHLESVVVNFLIPYEKKIGENRTIELKSIGSVTFCIVSEQLARSINDIKERRLFPIFNLESLRIGYEKLLEKDKVKGPLKLTIVFPGDHVLVDWTISQGFEYEMPAPLTNCSKKLNRYRDKIRKELNRLKLRTKVSLSKEQLDNLTKMIENKFRILRANFTATLIHAINMKKSEDVEPLFQDIQTEMENVIKNILNIARVRQGREKMFFGNLSESAENIQRLVWEIGKLEDSCLLNPVAQYYGGPIAFILITLTFFSVIGAIVGALIRNKWVLLISLFLTAFFTLWVLGIAEHFGWFLAI